LSRFRSIKKQVFRNCLTNNLISEKLGVGHLHGFDLWFDGDKIVFAYAKQPVWPPKRQTAWSEPEHRNDSYAHEMREIEKMLPLHLYEMNRQTGEIVQLTNDPYWGDSEPVYLPDGSIVFSSERSDAQNDSAISKPYQFGSAVSKLTQAVSPFKRDNKSDNKKVSLNCPFDLSPEEYEILALWVDANIPYTGEMLHRRTKDGRQNVWLPFEWQNPWITPISEPSISAK
jgi:hypothetical protein